MSPRRDRRLEVVSCDDCFELIAGVDAQRDPRPGRAQNELCPSCGSDARRELQRGLRARILDTRSRR